MKQRPVFILLTFFLALTSIVMITFVFLRTQLNEHKLQDIVEKTIHDNFVDFKVVIDEIGLNLGTKFRYKIGKIKIEYRNPNGVFNFIELNDVSIKFPLFFLLGKQDIDISVSEIKLDGFNHSSWIKNNYKITSLSIGKLVLPRFLVDNRINLTVQKLQFSNSVGTWPSPLQFNSIEHLVVKNISLTEQSAMEFDAVTSIVDSINDPLNVSVFAIGDIKLGQFVSNVSPDAKILMEVKSVNKPDFAWLTGQRIQFLRDATNEKTIISLHGNSAEGQLELVVNPNSMVFRGLELEFRLEDILRDNSTLKNAFHVVMSALKLTNDKDLALAIKGNLTYVSAQDNHWIAHLESSIENATNKVEIDIDSIKQNHVFNFKLGNDLSYRKVSLDCSELLCVGSNLKRIELNFYNQILSEAQFLSFDEVLSTYSLWWSSFIPLLSEEFATPLKIYWRKNRWSDFEFDLYADVAMSKNIFATENIKVKSSGFNMMDAKISFSNNLEQGLISRLISNFNSFPSSVLSKLAHATQLELTGTTSGLVVLEFTSAEKKYSADLKFKDGSITWLNFDDLYRQKLFFKPDDEIKYSNLNWVNQFKNSELTLQWMEKNKMISWELITPKNLKKLVKLDFSSDTSDIEADVSYPFASLSDKKYLQSHHGGTSFQFTMNLQPTELKLLDSQTSALEDTSQQ